MWSSLSNLQRFLTLSNGAAIRQCAFLTTPRPVGPPCELPANLVRVVDPVMSSNATNMAATFAHMQTPCHWFLHTSPPTNMAVRSVPVSACRLLVFRNLTEGAVFVGCCDANGGCTYDVSFQGRQHAVPAAEVTYVWSPIHCSACVHGGFHSPVMDTSTSITVCSPSRVEI